jgi:hypothetical protein
MERVQSRVGILPEDRRQREIRGRRTENNTTQHSLAVPKIVTTLGCQSDTRQTKKQLESNIRASKFLWEDDGS